MIQPQLEQGGASLWPPLLWLLPFPAAAGGSNSCAISFAFTAGDRTPNSSFYSSLRNWEASQRKM